ncbi:MAG: hypothetical protein WBA41_22320 [Rivularia sp. (in: cyanobacteria)]
MRLAKLNARLKLNSDSCNLPSFLSQANMKRRGTSSDAGRIATLAKYKPAASVETITPQTRPCPVRKNRI